MTPQKLKNSILQLAIQGKLVEQRPEEGTAVELYKRLIHEKEIGIKKGACGKSKSLSAIKEEDILFEIPNSWRWIRIGEIAAIVTKGTTPRGGNVSYTDKGIGFLRAENVAGLDKLDKTHMKYIDSDTHNGFLRRSILQADDILITIAGTLGRTSIVRENDLPLNVNQAIAIVRLVNPHDIELLYLVFALNSIVIQRYLTEQKKITAIPNLTLEIIENCLIPLPPLAEQKRIVAKIEELLPYIDRYEKAWNRLEDFNKRFPADMQKSILQLAIQGKLVEQRPEEGTALSLLQHIKIPNSVDGQRVKEKTVTAITENEIAFDIPASWQWVKLGSVCTIARGGSPRPIKNYITEEEDGVNWIKIGDTDKNGKYIYKTAEKIKPSGVSKSRMVHSGDFLLTNSMSFGRPYILKTDGCIHDGWLVISQNSEVFDQDYLFWLLSSAYAYWQFSDKVSGAVVKNLNSDKVANSVFPLPPLAEQKRIVAKLEELLPLCEKMKGIE